MAASAAPNAPNAPVTAGPDPDAELLRLCSAYLAVDEQRERIWATPSSSEADERRIEAETDPMGEQLASLASGIAKLPAVTHAGQRAKARVTFLLLPKNAKGELAYSEGITDDVTWSLVCDLVGRT